jgi:hypothetical protein
MELLKPNEDLEPRGQNRVVLDPNLWRHLPLELVVYILQWRTSITWGQAQAHMKASMQHNAGVVHQVKNMMDDLRIYLRLPPMLRNSRSLKFWAGYLDIPVLYRTRHVWYRLISQEDDIGIIPEYTGCVDACCRTHHSRAEIAQNAYYRLAIDPLWARPEDFKHSVVRTYARRRKYAVPCICCGRKVQMNIARALSVAKKGGTRICSWCRVRKCYENGLFGVHRTPPFG